MDPTNEKPIRHTIGKKREASWNRGKDKGTKVMIKFLKLYTDNPRKANDYFSKKTVTDTERATKAYYQFLTMEVAHVFKELANACTRYNFNLNDWITNYISWYYEDGGFELP